MHCLLRIPRTPTAAAAAAAAVVFMRVHNAREYRSEQQRTYESTSILAMHSKVKAVFALYKRPSTHSYVHLQDYTKS
jgi:hypothetical protein